MPERLDGARLITSPLVCYVTVSRRLSVACQPETIGSRQMPIAIERWVLVIWQSIIGPLFRPPAPFILVGIIPHVDKSVLFAATADEIDVTSEIGIVRLQDHFLAQGVVPQILVEFTITEMVRVV